MKATELLETLEASGTGKEKLATLRAFADEGIDDAQDLIDAMPDLGMPAGTIAKAQSIVDAAGGKAAAKSDGGVAASTPAPAAGKKGSNAKGPFATPAPAAPAKGKPKFGDGHKT